MISDDLFQRVEDNLHRAAKGPYCIDLIVSKLCNLKCLYCWGGDRPPMEDALSEEVLAQFLSSARDLQVKEISLTSAIGEPMLFKNLEVFMRNIKAAGFLGSLLTNGSMIDVSFAESLKKINWDVVCVSLDSFNPDIQYSLRPGKGAGDYLKNIRSFLEFCRDNIPALCLNLNMVVTALNYRDVGEYFTIAESYGVRNITLLKLVKMNDKYANLALSQSQLADFTGVIQNLRTRVSFNHLEWLGGGADRSGQKTHDAPQNPARHCYYHLYKVLIDSDGQVLVCNGNASEKTDFNIKNRPFKEIYFDLVKVYMSRRNNPACYDICCSPIKAMNQEIDYRLNGGTAQEKR